MNEKTKKKTFCFTVDDNVRFLKEITERGCESIFEHPYLALYKRLHDAFGLKVQLNLFYLTDGFELSDMPSIYFDEWRENSDWLKLSFHSRLENRRPYEFSSYDEVFSHCRAVNDEICRFASPSALARTTTIHYCLATNEGLEALKANGVEGLLGLFGDEKNLIASYGIDGEDRKRLLDGKIIRKRGICFSAIDIVLNLYDAEQIIGILKRLSGRRRINVMIHEQYFYEDYYRYQSDFAEKLEGSFEYLTCNKYESSFFEDLL